ncbi:MAG: SdiA-regulated domain-containing protein [Ferruginibacter sp.]
MKAIQYFLICLLLFAGGACTQPATVQNPPGYDLSKPEVYKMPAVLEEISGIAFKNGNADTIYAEQDEDGKLFYMHWGDAELSALKFARKGDYEDIAICNEWIVILKSDGTLFNFSFSQFNEKEPGNEQAGLLPAGEYESLYADAATNTLYVLCKDCPGSKKEKLVNGFMLKLGAGGQLTAAGNFSIDEKEIETLNGGKKINLKASAFAKNAQTGEWYILSSVNKILLVTDAAWKVKNVYPLAPGLFPQPEGIAFDNSHNLYISNEGGGVGAGSILKFVYQNK